MPFVGMCLAGGGASSIEGPSASFADGQVVVATWVGTVDHSVTGAVAAVAGRHDGGVDLVDGHRDAVVKDVAFAFKIFPTHFHAVLDDAPMQLVHIFKSLFQQVGRGFFTLDSSGAVGEYFFVFEVGQFFDALGKLPEVVDVYRDRIFEVPRSCSYLERTSRITTSSSSFIFLNSSGSRCFPVFTLGSRWRSEEWTISGL